MRLNLLNICAWEEDCYNKQCQKRELQRQRKNGPVICPVTRIHLYVSIRSANYVNRKTARVLRDVRVIWGDKSWSIKTRSGKKSARINTLKKPEFFLKNWACPSLKWNKDSGGRWGNRPLYKSIWVCFLSLMNQERPHKRDIQFHCQACARSVHILLFPEFHQCQNRASNIKFP